MFCRNCGQQIDDKAAICIHCGQSVQNSSISSGTNTNDAPNTGMAVLGFFIPIAGLIIWAFCHDSQPLMAKSAAKGALIGFIVNLIGVVFYFVFAFLFPFFLMILMSLL